ncbi:MAG TPA: hypothetical protein PKB15_06735 [Acidimicrobiia bacterium]|jgi:antitoxin component of RelBE/YafQ-DinJ toxin-antitoxin module|nr:hypothetical protein [Acidimicrobiia bacterium]
MASKKSSNKNQREGILNEGWEDAGEIELTFDLAYSVFSLRISHELLTEITRQAKKLKIKPSTYARQLLEQGVASDAQAPLEIMTQVMNNIAHQLPKVQKSVAKK